MSYCVICRKWFGYSYVNCPDNDCLIVRNFIKSNGIKKLKEIIKKENTKIEPYFKPKP